MHKLHDDHPLAPEKMKINENMLSGYCLDIAKKYGIKVGKVNKLLTTLSDKDNYVIHYRDLQLYKALGIKVAKIYIALNFKQSDWLKPFVLFNTEKRMRATNEFDKKFFKLMINSVYGKI